MKNKLTLLLISILALTLVGCGTLATPVAPGSEDTSAETEDHGEGDAVAEAVTEVPTEVPTEEPTEVPPTEVPATEVPTEEPAEEPAEEEAAPAADDPISVLVSIANAEHGQELFNTTYDTMIGPFACSTCHLPDSESMLIGPGLWNISVRGAERVEGESAAQYIYNSIINPGAYVVEGYADGVMPANYHDILSDNEIYDIIAYLMTLRD